MLDIFEELDAINPIETLRTFLRTYNLSEREFAKSCGIPASAFNEIIRMKRRPTEEVALKIQNRTNISAETLVLYWESNKIREKIRQITCGQN